MFFKRGCLFPSMMGMIFFFLVGNQNLLFNNFYTATHGATFNHVFKKKLLKKKRLFKNMTFLTP
jgi:hypothetical protein